MGLLDRLRDKTRPLATRLQKALPSERLTRDELLQQCAEYLAAHGTERLSHAIHWLEQRLAAAPDQSRRLQRLLESQRIHYLDVGARGGPQEEIAKYLRFIDLWLCEPEPEEANRLESQGFSVIRSALAAQAGSATLHITRSRGSSSLLAPRGPIRHYGTIDLSAVDVLHTVEVETTTLDAVCAEREVRFDAIKLDTQGYEPEILDGLTERLPLWIRTEVSLEPIYENQRTFWELGPALHARGYMLAGLFVNGCPWVPAGTAHGGPMRGRLSAGIPLHGDAFFMPSWLHETGRAAIQERDLAYAALMLIHGQEDVLRFVIEELDLPHADQIREALALPAG